jgi:Methyltransferase domain
VAKWLVKAILQGAASYLPRGESWNYRWGKYITGALEMDATRFRTKLCFGRRHLENCFHTLPKDKKVFNVLEIGTGWYPVIPIAFWLCGASSIWTIDNVARLRRTDVTKTLELFREAAQQGHLMEILPWASRDRVDALISGNSDEDSILTDRMFGNIEVIVGDARHTGLKPGSIDFFFSNSVLQEIGEDALTAIFAEFKRLAAPTAAMSHYVNMVEPYVAFDRLLNPYHFLGYSDWTWRLLNNSLHPHNRLRIADYRRIHQYAGFPIVREENEQGSSEDLHKIRLADRFQCYSRNDLLVLRSWILSTAREGQTQVPG